MANSNPYLQDVASSGWNSGLSQGIAMAGTGATLGATLFASSAAAGPIGAAVGLVVGGLMGLFTHFEKQRQYEGLMNDMIINRAETVEQRNELITQAQEYINTTRVTFDETYGEGMYDQYNELFKAVLGMPSGSQTAMDLLSSLSLDSIEGQITSSVSGKNIVNGVISASDVNSAYLEYMMNSIKDADTAIGLQYQQASYQENSLIRDYYDSIDQYNAQVAQQFASAFLQQRQTNISLEGQIGEAATAQASSGLRSVGSGNNLSAIAQFQKDLSDVAYASTLDYMVASYGTQMKASTNNLIDEVYASRNNIAIMDKQVMSNFFSTMREHFSNLNNSFYTSIKKHEETIKEQNELIEDYSEAAGQGRNAHYEEIDDFDE